MRSRTVIAFALTMAVSAGAYGDAPRVSAVGQPPTSIASFLLTAATPKACCKVCRAGKACGDSCISQSKTCHKAPGCACDAAD